MRKTAKSDIPATQTLVIKVVGGNDRLEVSGQDVLTAEATPGLLRAVYHILNAYRGIAPCGATIPTCAPFPDGKTVCQCGVVHYFGEPSGAALEGKPYKEDR